MDQKRKKELLQILEEEIKKAKTAAQERRKTAKDFRLASRSQQGDRRFFENVADIAESRLDELLKFQKELKAIPEKPNQKVEPICFVTVEYPDGKSNRFYFASQAIPLTKVQVISFNSPLGQAIKDKKVGEQFSYQIREEQTSGRIIKID